MKSLRTIFLTITALFALSCTTDVTNDLDVQLGNGEGQTSLALSLEGARTQLGNKSEEGVYPLTWSAGDAIAVNGVASSALTEEQAGAASALFTFTGEVSRPYNVVYPAPSTDVMAETEGFSPVTFLANQEYVEGTFCSGAAPMYGYAGEGSTEAIQMQHLAGVLRIAPKGEGVTLQQMTITSESGCIAGNFDVNCSKGTIVPHTNASNTITMSFGEGLALGAEATPIYVAVPKGSYGTLAITLATATDKMVVKFNSNLKPITAGTVREFTEFEYQANSSATEEVFEIDSKEALIEFARIASTFYPRTKAVVTAPIDMSGYEWTPIENFGSFIFDGGENEIKGLSAPLFNSTSATIRNLRLTDVEIETIDTANYGAIACHLNGGALENCSATGNMTYTLATVGLKRVGGLIGYANNCGFFNNTNNVNINFIGELAAGDGTLLHMGGAAGWLSNPKTTISNCSNNGSITITGGIDRTDIGGFIGYCDAAAEVVNCHNNGEILLAASLRGSGFSVCTGFIGCADAGFEVEKPTFKITNCSNTGDVTFGTKGGDDTPATAGEVSAYMHLGGFFGHTRDLTEDYFNVEITNCQNRGNVTANLLKASSNLKVSGVISNMNTDAVIDGCTNYGKLSIIRGANNPFIGALIGQVEDVTAETIDVVLKNSTNEGEIYVSSNVQHTANSNLGSITAYANNGSADGNVNYTLENVHNNGNITFNNIQTGASHLYIGGLIGYVRQINLSMNNCTNTKTLNFGCTVNTSDRNMYIGGIIGYNSATCNLFKGVKNMGAMNISGSCSLLSIGGIIGGYGQIITFDECSNNGAITIDNKQSHNPQWMYVGGVAGVCLSTTAKATTAKNSSNNGVIEVKNYAVAKDCGIGGLFGQIPSTDGSAYCATYDITSCTNNGEIKVSSVTAASGLYVGGILSFNSKKSVKMESCANKGALTFDLPTATGILYVGGLIGSHTTTAISANNSYNSGAITLLGKTSTGKTKSLKAIYLGGLAGYPNVSGSKYSNCYNSGDITLEDGVASTGNIRMGGCIGYVNANTANNSIWADENVANYGNIYVGATTTTQILLGGVYGYIDSECKNVGGYYTNTGNITITGGTGASTNAFGLALGGVVGAYYGSAANCVNIGNISVTGKSSVANSTIGGIIGFSYGYGEISNCQSYCNIEAYQLNEEGFTLFKNVGLITGSTRIKQADTDFKGGIERTAVIRNCQLGGKVVKDYVSMDERVVWETLSSSNYTDYIYGSGINTNWEGTDNYDGCTVLTAAPVVDKMND